MAGNANAIRAGRAFVEIFADDSKLNRSLSLALGKLKNFGEGVRSLGQKMILASTAAIAPFGVAVKAFISQGDELAKAADRTGVGVEALSELKYAADQSGTSLQGLETGFKGMAKFMLSAAEGSGSAAEAITRLGLSFSELANMSPEQRFETLADRLAQISDPTERAALSMQVFGKAAVDLLPLMKNGAKGIRELREAARELGQTWSEEDARAAEELGDRMDDLWKVVGAGVRAVGSALAPMVRALVVTFTRGAKTVLGLIKANRELFQTIAVLVVGFGAMGAVLVTTGIAIKVFAIGLSLAASSFSLVLKSLGLLKLALLAFASPLGLIIAGLAGVAAAVLYFTDNGGKAIAYLTDRFTAFGVAAKEIWTGIVEAVRSGDLALAGQIAFATLKLGWVAAISFMKQQWAGFKQYFLEIALGAWYGAQAAFELFTDGMASAWFKTINTLQTAWAKFTRAVTDMHDKAVDYMEDRRLEVIAKNEGLDINELRKMAKQSRDQRAGRKAEDRNAEDQKYESDLQKKLDDLEAAHKKRMAEIGQASIDDSEAVKALTGKEIADAQKELEDARNELNKLLKGQAAYGSGGVGAIGGMLTHGLQEAMRAAGNMAGNMGNTPFEQGIQSRGALSGFALQSLQGGGTEVGRKLDTLNKTQAAMYQLAKSGFNVSVFYK